MNKQMIALAASLLAFGAPANAGDLAQPLPPAPLYPVPAYPAPASALPPYEIVAIVRSIGLRPLHRPVRQGPAYMLGAVDPAGEEVRVVVDARLGRIVRIDPVLRPPYMVPDVPPPYGRPPGRIVMIPDGPTSRIAELPPGGPPGPGYGGPPNAPAPRAPAAGAPPPSAQAGPPLPRPRPKVAAADTLRAGPAPSAPAVPSAVAPAAAASRPVAPVQTAPPPAPGEIAAREAKAPATSASESKPNETKPNESTGTASPQAAVLAPAPAEFHE